MIRAGARTRHPRLLREAAGDRPGRQAPRLTELARRARGGHPGRLPQPLRRPRSARCSGCSSWAPIGPVNTALAEAYGPVVLKPAGRTWRSQRATGGGCLYDYAAHPLNLLTWYLGAPESVSGSQLTSIFSAQIDDARRQHAALPDGHGPAVVNWSDESQRKMTTKITLWGTARPDLRRPAGDPGLPARHRARPRGLPVRLERPLHHRPDRGALVLPARRGVQRPAGRLRARGSPVARSTGENDFASAALTDRVIADDQPTTRRADAPADRRCRPQVAPQPHARPPPRASTPRSPRRTTAGPQRCAARREIGRSIVTMS